MRIGCFGGMAGSRKAFSRRSCCSRRPRTTLLMAQGITGPAQPCVLYVAENAHKRPRSTVVYFAGDLQDCTSKAMRSAGNGYFDRYNLQETAEALAVKHNATHCLCVRASILLEGRAAYADFCPSYQAGRIPSYDGASGHATEHLVALLDDTLGSNWGDGALELVAFSRGLVVINQLISELAHAPAEDDSSDKAFQGDISKHRAIHRLWTCVRALHDVDGANEGPHYPLPEEGVNAAARWLCFAKVAGTSPGELSWCMHTTSYTYELDASRAPEKEPEQTAFIDAVRQGSGNLLRVECYEGISLDAHFKCLEEYHVPSVPFYDVEHNVQATKLD